MKRLEEEGFVVYKIEQKNYKKVYSLNYKKIIEEFINFLKNKKQAIFLEAKSINKNEEWIKEKVLPYDFSTYNLLEDKLFLENIKNNSYLQEYFKEVFKKLGELNFNLTLEDFFNFLLMRELFIRILSNMRLFIRRKNENENLEILFRKEEDILRKDRELNIFKQFCELLYLCRKSIILDIANYNGIKNIERIALLKNFQKTKVEDFLKWEEEIEHPLNENLFLTRDLEILMLKKNYKRNKKKK